MDSPRILVADDLSLCIESLEPLKKIGSVDYIFPFDRADVLRKLPGRDAYFGHTDVKVDEELLNRADRLKVVCTCSTGTDHIDKAALRARGIHLIAITTEYELLDTFTSTAEMAWSLLLASLRRLPHQFELAKQGHIGLEPGTVPQRQLSNKTLGILGYGRLGRMVGEYGKAFRMKVLACDIKPIEAEGIQQVDFDTLIEESDVLSLHIHLTPETHHIISRDVLFNMKKGATLVNVARGDLVDEQALLEALESGHLAGAGLDVIHNEWDPHLDQRPLLEYARNHHNLIITPHTGGGALESIIGARMFVASKLAEYLTSA